MKRVILMLSAILISTSGFAQTSHLSKNSAQLNALGSAWKAKQYGQVKQNKNDIAIVYGGEDISRRPTISTHTTIA